MSVPQKRVESMTQMKRNDALAFILGFATLMPRLSQQIYPLDVRNIESLIAKIMYLHIEPHQKAQLKIIASKLRRFSFTTIESYWPEYWDYYSERRRSYTSAYLTLSA